MQTDISIDSLISKENIELPKIAICFHLFYQELFSQFTQYIDNVLNCSYDTDIYITYNKESEIIEDVRKYYPNAIFIFSEKGCDTGAFLLHMKYMYEFGKNYDYVFKLHTKRMPVWRAQLLEPIAGSCEIVKTIINDFSNHSKIGMIGVDRWRIGNDNDNKTIVDIICDRNNIKIKSDACFIAGTIFWMRYDIIKKLVERNNMNFQKEYDLCEFGYPHGAPTYTHSWERLFGIIISNFDYDLKFYKCNIDPNSFCSNLLPINFNWKIYTKFYSDIISPFVEGIDSYIKGISKILYGIDLLQSIDVTKYIRSYSNNQGIVNMMNFQITNHLGDPFPFNKKKLFIYCNNENNPETIINEYNGLIDRESHLNIYKGRLFFLFEKETFDNLNEKIAIHHYMNTGQFENRKYDLPSFDPQLYAKNNELTLTNDNEGINYLLDHYITNIKNKSLNIAKTKTNLLDKFSIKFIALYFPKYLAIESFEKCKQKSVLYKDHRIKLPNLSSNFNQPINYEIYRNHEDMAKKHGLSSFCINHKWKNSLHQNFETEVLISKTLIMNFCFFWKLKDNNYSDHNDHFAYLLPFFLNPKYIKINNKPMFVIDCNHPNYLQEIIENWELLAKRSGFDGIIIITSLNESTKSEKNTLNYVEWYPQYIQEISQDLSIDYDHYRNIPYDRICYKINQLQRIGNIYFRGMFINYDNSMVCKENEKPTIINNQSHLNLSRMILSQINNVLFYPNQSNVDNYIFIKSWNDWQHQNFIEPDNIEGYKTLLIFKNIIESYNSI